MSSKTYCSHLKKYIKGDVVTKIAPTIEILRGAWVTQLVERLTLAQVMISRLVGLSPASGSVLTAQSLEPASDSVCVSLSLPLPYCHSVSVSQKWINVKKSFLFCLMFIYFWEREAVWAGEGQRDRGTHRIRSRLQALSCQHRARRGAQTHELWDHDLSRSRTSNLTEPPRCLWEF